MVALLRGQGLQLSDRQRCQVRRPALHPCWSTRYWNDFDCQQVLLPGNKCFQTLGQFKQNCTTNSGSKKAATEASCQTVLILNNKCIWPLDVCADHFLPLFFLKKILLRLITLNVHWTGNKMTCRAKSVVIFRLVFFSRQFLAFESSVTKK